MRDVRATDGQTMAEYAVALSVITVAVVGVLGAFAFAVGDAVDRVVDLIVGLPLA